MITFNTFDKLITVLSTMAANITTYQTQVGATAADITFIDEALANLNYLRTYADDVDAAKKGVFQIKETAFRGDPSETVPPFPVFAAGASPTPVAAGYLERVNILIRRFKLGPGYNHDIGVALGFETSDPTAPTDPATVKPTVEALRRRPVMSPQSSSRAAAIRICGKSRRRPSVRSTGRSSPPLRESPPT